MGEKLKAKGTTQGFLVTQLGEHLPAVQETWARFLGQKNPLEKEMATHSSTLAWKSPWAEEPGRLQSTGSHKSDTTSQLHQGDYKNKNK